MSLGFGQNRFQLSPSCSDADAGIGGDFSKRFARYEQGCKPRLCSREIENLAQGPGGRFGHIAGVDHDGKRVHAVMLTSLFGTQSMDHKRSPVVIAMMNDE